jgi:hypothetical protein
MKIFTTPQAISFFVLDHWQIENFHDKNFLPDFLLSGNKKNSRIFSLISTHCDIFPFNTTPGVPLLHPAEK